MAVPRLISPLLDGFAVGEAISNHHGVQSCPALRLDTEERYILKIVSIPPSQNQLDALLLSGAFSNEQSALSYFKDLSEDVCKEAAILSQLSKLEGFLPYQSSQTIKMAEGCGYQVYLLSPYRRSLDRQIKTNPLSHLAAVNLGLDMCAALAVCRKAGFLYVNLKPENIYISDMRGYCIGDLGFIPLSSVKYASLPEKYRSRYTPPEISDAYASLSDNPDIYALGLVLYQVFNNGILPEPDEAPMPVPMYADYEMAAIIMKACAPHPQDRWSSPEEMGQALVDYMQRNAVDDVPIVPAPVIEDIPLQDEPEEFLSEEENDQELAELLALIPDEEPPIESIEEAPSGEPSEEYPVETEVTVEETPLDNDNLSVEDAETDSEVIAECPVDEFSENDQANTSTESEEEIIESQTSSEELGESNDSQEESTEEAATAADDVAQTAPPEESAETVQEEDIHPRTELTEEGVTTEVAEMLAQADQLLQMELPEPVVAPAPIDVPIPPPIVLPPEQPQEPEEIDVAPEAEQTEEQPQEDVTAEPTPSVQTPEEPQIDSVAEPQPPKKRKLGGIIAGCIALVVLAAVIAFASHYYKNVYLQTINYIEITGSGNEISVRVETGIDEGLLTVVCTDTYGNTFRAPLVNGVANFTALQFGTRYTISMDISGFHKLQGMTSGSHTTAHKTEILNFQVSPGVEEGTAIISFTVNGPSSNNWTLHYSAPGVEPGEAYFTGTKHEINNLVLGADYTFELIPSDKLFIVGNSNITSFTPQRFVFAQDIVVQSYRDGVLELVWSAPEGTSATKWMIRCFNGNGYDQEFTSEECRCAITNLDPSTGYTIQITAEGMPQSKEITVTANPINVTQFHAKQNAWYLAISWDYVGEAPANGWVLLCESDNDQIFSLDCTDAEATIPVLPNQSFHFQVKPKDDITYFSPDPFQVTTSMLPYDGHSITSDDITITMYHTPEEENCNANDLLQSTPVNTLEAGASATVLLRLSKSYSEDKELMTTTFVIIDSNNNLVSCESTQKTWELMWKDFNSVATLPSTPSTPGNYTLCVYLTNNPDDMEDQRLLGTVSFEII